MKKPFCTALIFTVLATAGQAWATPATADSRAVAEAIAPAGGPSVKVTGATLHAAKPLLLGLKGARMAEPSFEALSDAVRASPAWSVEKVGRGETPVTRLSMEGAGGEKLSMDVSTELKTALGLKIGDRVTAENARSGRGAMIVFYRDRTPLGLVPNDEVSLPR